MNKSLTALIILVVIGGGAWLLFKNQPLPTGTDMDTSDTISGSEMDDTTAGDTSAGTDMGSVGGTTTNGGFTTTGGIATGGTSVGKAVALTIEGSNFKFAPNTLSVNKGDTITIVFKNSGGMHKFTIDEFNVSTKKINDGEQDTVTFVADKAGSFEFYCSVGSHRQMGMKGTLIVN